MSDFHACGVIFRDELMEDIRWLDEDELKELALESFIDQSRREHEGLPDLDDLARAERMYRWEQRRSVGLSRSNFFSTCRNNMTIC